jgi:hypothetical protein
LAVGSARAARRIAPIGQVDMAYGIADLFGENDNDSVGNRLTGLLSRQASEFAASRRASERF